MQKETDTIREEGVITILNRQKNLTGICWKNTTNGGDVKLYKVEEVSYGEMKDFLESIVEEHVKE